MAGKNDQREAQTQHYTAPCQVPLLRSHIWLAVHYLYASALSSAELILCVSIQLFLLNKRTGKDIDILKDNAAGELASAALMNEALRPRTGLHKTASICALHVKTDRKDRQSSASTQAVHLEI